MSLILIGGLWQVLKSPKKAAKAKMQRINKQIKKEQEYRCFVTGKRYKSSQLDVHHGYSKSWYPWLKYNKSYLFVLLRKEHVWLHTLFLKSFKSHCTPADLYLYKEMRNKKLLMSKKAYMKHKKAEENRLWAKYALIIIAATALFWVAQHVEIHWR